MRPPVRALPSPWKGSLKHFILFGLTAASIFWVGLKGWGFTPPESVRLMTAVLAIMLAHEMGHYVACRRHRVDATLPFFIPFPIHLLGTFGAFIRIRSPFPDRKALFDIGIAGPFAGFVASLPVLVLGVLELQVVPFTPPTEGTISFGAPWLLTWLEHAYLGELSGNVSLRPGPYWIAAWFGLLLTALNMMPVGQLDGGHVTYSVIRERALYVTRAAFGVAAVLVYLRPTWLLWAVLLLLLSRPHPPTLYDAAPLGRARTWLAVVGVAVFAVCFTPNPIITTWTDFFRAMREIGAAVATWLTSR